MHEFSIVENLIEQVDRRAREEGAQRVILLSFRRGGTFSREALFQAVESFSRGTLLEGAEVRVEDHEHLFRCPDCPHSQSVTHDDLEDHAFTCPKCGRTTLIDEEHDLELLEIQIE